MSRLFKEKNKLINITMFRKKSKRTRTIKLNYSFYLSRHKGFGNNPEKQKQNKQEDK